MKNSTLESVEGLKQKIFDLQAEVARLRKDYADLELSLNTVIEHGDTIEEMLAQNNVDLKSEICARKETLVDLQSQFHNITQQKDDLETLVQMVTEHSDEIDNHWQEKYQVVEVDSLTDGLTNAANRRHFDQYLNTEWQRAIREQNEISLIMFDIDFFKSFNDHFGHSSGDICLKEIVRLAQQCISRPADLLFRYGGEEFAVVLPNTSIEGAIKLAHEIKESIADAKLSHSPAISSDYVTVSVGVDSCRPTAGMQPLELIDSADQYLYKAKLHGKNRVISKHCYTKRNEKMVKNYGSFTEIKEDKKLESLNLNFLPCSKTVQERWQHNGLSADFLGDYFTVFFPNKNDSEANRIAEVKNAVSYIANELLENAMKYAAENCMLPTSIGLYLDNSTIVFNESNHVENDQAETFMAYIEKFMAEDPNDFYLQQLENSAMSEEGQSGLGFLTMVNDYMAKLGWQFESIDETYTKVTTQVIIKL